MEHCVLEIRSQYRLRLNLFPPEDGIDLLIFLPNRLVSILYRGREDFNLSVSIVRTYTRTLDMFNLFMVSELVTVPFYLLYRNSSRYLRESNFP